MKKILLVFMVGLLIPCASFADALPFQSMLGNLFSSGNSQTSTAPNANQTNTNTVAPQQQPSAPQMNSNSGYQQNSQYGQSYDPQLALRENLVRCMYIGKLVEMNTALSQESDNAQTKARHATELYTNLKCSDQLKAYSYVWQDIDKAMGICTADDNCQLPVLGNGNASMPGLGGSNPAGGVNTGSAGNVNAPGFVPLNNNPTALVPNNNVNGGNSAGGIRR